MSTDITPTIRHLLAAAEKQIHNSQDTNARLESEILLAFLLNKARSYLYTWPEKELTTEQSSQYHQLVERRCAGEPVAYITGSKEFWGLPLTVTPDTLIPRPETEHLVEIALQHIPADKPSRIADLGTGSGAIALAIASERPKAIIEACDSSAAAIAVAKQNQSQLNIPNVQFSTGSWFQTLTSEPFDIVISNPPYVAEGDPHLSQGDLRFEPSQALSSGVDGLNDIREIIQTATQHINNAGWLLLEHGFDQADAVVSLFEEAGYSEVECFRDYAKLERATIGLWLT